MAEKLLSDFECQAPQFVDFDATATDATEQPTFLDDYFDNRVSFWARDKIVDEENTLSPSEDDGALSNDQNWKTPSNLAIERLQKTYRVPLPVASLSPSINSGSPSQESPELEYTRPWLNQSCSTLISGMEALQLRTPSAKFSLTRHDNRFFSRCIETSTPFITVKEKSKPRSVDTRKQDTNPLTPENRVEKSNETTTQIEFWENVEPKTSKLSENNGEGSTYDNLKHAETTGGSFDNFVPIARNDPNYEKNTLTEMILGKSEPVYTKDVTENILNDSENKTQKLDRNLPEQAQDLELDENFDDAAGELLKLHSRVDATGKEEGNGREIKTRKPGVLVNKARRQSLKFRRKSGKFVSMAEAILKYQKSTPKRFYSTKRMMKSGPLQAVVQASRKLTLAASPVLMSKLRCRRTTASNNQATETEKNAAKRIETSKKITQTASSSSNTRINEVRDKSENRKKITTKNPSETIPAIKKPFVIAKNLPGESKKMMNIKSEAKPMKSTSSNTKTDVFSRLATKTTKSSSKLVSQTRKKTGDPSLKTDGEKSAPGATKKLQTKAKTKSTCALSFEERNKLLLKNREEFAKRMIEQEKQRRIFHARPAPIFKPVPGSSTENLKISNNHQNVETLKTATLNCGIEKQENRSPLKTVHDSSMGNLKIEYNQQNAKTPRTGYSNFDLENQENRSPSKTVHDSSMENLEIEPNQPNLKTPRTGNSRYGSKNPEKRSHLHTEKRSRKRQVFDAQIKKKEEEEEVQRKEEEIERLAMIKDQDKELRKTMTLKAKPMPIFQHRQIAKSRKPLTDAQSPAWSRKAKK